MFDIPVMEVRGYKKSLKLKNKLTGVHVDETFEDILVKLGRFLTQGTRHVK